MGTGNNLARHPGADDGIPDLSAFAVAPEFQRRGIGTRLLRHCLDIADRARLPAWLTSLPGSYGLYLRLGFRDIDHRDADLNA